MNEIFLVDVVLDLKCNLRVIKSFEQAFDIFHLFFVLKKILKLYPPSKTIHQWLLDENVCERQVLPSWRRVETFGSYHSPFSF